MAPGTGPRGALGPGRTLCSALVRGMTPPLESSATTGAPTAHDRPIGCWAAVSRVVRRRAARYLSSPAPTDGTGVLRTGAPGRSSRELEAFPQRDRATGAHR